MFPPAALPGFLAGASLLFRNMQDLDSVSRSSFGPIDVWYWGLDPYPDKDLTVAVSRVVRDTNGSVPAGRVAALLRSDPAALTRLLPPFGAVAGSSRQVMVVADSMGVPALLPHPSRALN